MRPDKPCQDFSRLLSPRGVAIVGASEDERRIGGEPVRFLAEFGYRGKVYPVNPKRSEIRGLRCYPDVASIPRPCDVAVVAVASGSVPHVIEQCGAAGIRFAVVLSAGFREAGAEGVAREAELKSAIDRSGVRVVGPNCLGLMNVNDRVFCGFGSGFQYPDLKPGPLALVTQSGGFGATMMVRAQDAGLGMSYFVSNGNAVDISILELVEYFLERDDVEVVSMFIEGVPDGRRLREVGKRALELRKPILVCKAGNSEAGRRAAASHTATLTAGYTLYRTAFNEGGFIEMRDADDLIDMARAFQGRLLPRGNRVVVVTGSGGAGVVASDRCEEYGMQLPPLSDTTLTRLRELLPGFAAASNPVDISGQRSQTGRSVSNGALEIVRADEVSDQVIVRSKQSTNKPQDALELAQIARRAGKPVLVALGADRDSDATRVLDEHRIPWHVTIPRAVVAAKALNDFAQKLKRHDRRRSASERPVALEALTFAAGAATLSEHESKGVLAAYGIPVVREVLLTLGAVESLKELPAALSFPLAVKVDSPDIPHKTEAGAVVLNVGDLARLKRASEEVCHSARRYRRDARINGVLIEQMASGVEVIMGAVNDPYFGPVIAVGLGGVFTELLHDVTHRFAPFSGDTALEMIDELKGAKLLHGYRGKPAHDVDALADALVRFSWLAADHADRIAEIDVNPLFVGVAGVGVLAADALVVLREQND